MKIKEGFVTREISGTIFAVPTGDLTNEFQGIIKLTESAKLIWDLLQEDTTIEEIMDNLFQKYDFDVDKTKLDVERFINNLKSSNLIVE